MTPISCSVTTALSQTATSSSTTRVSGAKSYIPVSCAGAEGLFPSVTPSFTSTVNSVPIPLMERTEIFPPIKSRMFFEMASPSPVAAVQCGGTDGLLAEWFKNVRKKLFAHSGPCIVYNKAQCSSVLCPFPLFNGKGDSPFIGEFDGIPQDIQKYLLQLMASPYSGRPAPSHNAFVIHPFAPAWEAHMALILCKNSSVGIFSFLSSILPLSIRLISKISLIETAKPGRYTNLGYTV